MSTTTISIDGGYHPFVPSFIIEDNDATGTSHLPDVDESDDNAWDSSYDDGSDATDATDSYGDEDSHDYDADYSSDFSDEPLFEDDSLDG